MRINKEHFWRELTFIYDNYTLFNNKIDYNRDSFIEGYADFVSQGGEFEIIDGDNNEVHSDILDMLFKKVEDKTGQLSPFVISILGP